MIALKLLLLATSLWAADPISSQLVEITAPLPLPVISTSAVVNSYDAIVLSVVAAAGAGQQVFSSTGTLKQCSVVPPSPTASYEMEIVTNDADQFPIMGSSKVVGSVSFYASRIILGSHLFKISLASADGTYRARCVIQK